MTSAAKTCDLNPVTMFILQEFVETFQPFLTVLCNQFPYKSLTHEYPYLTCLTSVRDLGVTIDRAHVYGPVVT